MRNKVIPGLAILVLVGCSGGRVPVIIGAPSPDVVVVEDGDREGRGDEDYRSLQVPKGHYPPPGECRVWYADRPPGHQPPPEKCDRLYGRVPVGAFILYNDKAWDADYDWDRYSRRYEGRVPPMIVRLAQSMRRRD